MKYFIALIFTFAMFSSVALAVDDAACKAVNSTFISVNGVCMPGNTGLSDKSVQQVVEGILTWILGIFGVLGVLTFLIAGIMYLTAAGDTTREETAKNAMKMGVIGIIVGLAGFVVIQAIDAMLNAKTTF